MSTINLDSNNSYNLIFQYIFSSGDKVIFEDTRCSAFTLHARLTVLERCTEIYETATDHIRRLLNQVLTHRITITKDQVTIELAELFKTLATTATTLLNPQPNTKSEGPAQTGRSFTENNFNFRVGV
ncbi:hypothetical protein [Psychromicrobium sp. YIM B11713]|uniref:hypothetical protein n=1 Tax=Psychromicrobium sp. YIM B11713 TaxID=3145233 RepID=UPI00374FC09B